MGLGGFRRLGVFLDVMICLVLFWVSGVGYKYYFVL